jgi:superfamily II DNA or RNA helicase
MVRRRNQPEAVGLVREARWDEQAESWNYVVQFGAALKGVPEESLEPYEVIETPWDALARGKLAGQRHFSITLTYHRLRRPPARIANSFTTARTDFYIHQFKPLLKFLDNPSKRLLIADDVGLGKTIEAGYILRELQAQQGAIERVLIVVPARLGPKWKRELRTRFDEHFDLVKAHDLLRLCQRLRQGHELDAFHWIISYEGIRPKRVREAIRETELTLDLLICDEAHRMRSTESLQHKVGMVLTEAADAVLFLSATPVQNRLDDLHAILRMLSPDEFAEWRLFESQMEANRRLLAAQKALSKRPADVSQARAEFRRFCDTAIGRELRESAYLRSVETRINTTEDLRERRALVELQADLSRLSPLGYILTRTRKVEAMPNRPRRNAVWKTVRLSVDERQIYDRVTELCRLAWQGQELTWGFQMILIMAYRAAASCLSAAMGYFAERLGVTGPGTTATSWQDEWEEAEEPDSIPDDDTLWTGRLRNEWRAMVQAYGRLQDRDTKFDVLVQAIQDVWRDDLRKHRHHRKIVVFSFFKRTLGYLQRRLEATGILNRTIHGGIGVADREDAIEDFLESKDINVLITSEVGGEGIDLQKASVVINYDLPWNPMVVEQRIGRLDRIGQTSDLITVISLVIEDSIEERIVQRLLEKIEVFKQSVGELEPILGDAIERLARDALRGELTKTEMEEMVEARGAALARRIRDAREMLSRVDGIIAADQGLIDEIEAIVTERQIPNEGELFQILNATLSEEYAGLQIPEAALTRVVGVDFRGPIGSDLERFSPDLGPEASTLGRRMQMGPIRLTFSRSVAYRHSGVELLHGRHPLVRYAAVKLTASSATQQRAFILEVDTSSFPGGFYGFLVAMVEVKSVRPHTRLAAILSSLDGQQVWVDQDQVLPLLIQLLDRGQDLSDGDPPSFSSNALKRALTSGLSRLLGEWEARERQLDEGRRAQQLATLRAMRAYRVRRAKERLEALLRRIPTEFAVRMAQARLDKATRELEAVEGLVDTTWGGLEPEEIAVGLFRVRKGG